MNKNENAPIRFKKPQKRGLYMVFGLLWLSGAGWLVAHYFMRVSVAFGDAPHPIENWWLRLHGLLVFVALVALGAVLSTHAQRAWKLKKNRYSGMFMKSVFLWLAISGYALYYFTTEENAAWLPLLHWVVGLSVPLLLVLHISQGRSRVRPKPHQYTDESRVLRRNIKKAA